MSLCIRSNSADPCLHSDRKLQEISLVLNSFTLILDKAGKFCYNIIMGKCMLSESVFAW